MPPEFKVDPRSRFFTYRRESQIRVEMSPDEFLCLAASDFEVQETIKKRRTWGRLTMIAACEARNNFPRSSDETLEALRTAMREGKDIEEPPYLDYDVGLGRVTNHEGRNRATVARELGIKTIPVIVWFHEEGGFTPATAQDIGLFEKYRDLSCRSCGSDNK